MLTFSRYFAALFSILLLFVSVLTNANIGQDVAVNVQNSLDSPISEALTNIDNGVALTDSSSDISFSGSSASSSVLRFLVMGDWGTFTSTNKRKLDDVEMLGDNNQNQNQNNNQNKNNNQNQNNNNNQNKNNNNNNQNNGGTYWSVLVAAAMANYASANPVSFLIALGDNFYDIGVTSTTDSLWTSVYTNVYSADSLQVPWYAIFGNHDYGSNKGAGSLQAQIDYGEYHMDSKWSAGHCYMKSFTIPDSSATLEVVFIDTTLIAPQETYITSTSNGVTQDVQDYLQQEQLDCMEGYLAASTASFLLVAGHYPIYSTGKNSPGDMDTMVEAVYPYLEKYNVDAYLCGHDHLLQHLAYTTSSGTSMDFIVSGAAGKPDNQLTSGITSAATMKFAAATGGFAAVTATTSQMTVDLIDYTGTTLYTVTRSQQRSTAAYGSVSDGSSTDGSSSDVSNNTPVEETVVDTKEEKAVDAVTKEDKIEDAKKAEQETYVGTFNSMNVDIRRVVEVGVLGVTFIAIVAFLAVAKSVFGGKPAGDDMVLDVRQDVEAGAVRPGVVTKKMIRMTHNNAKGGVRHSPVLTPGALQSKTHASPPAIPHTPAPSTAATATASSTTTTPGVHSTVVNPGKRWFPAANNVSPVVAANQHRSMNTSRRGLTNHPLLQHRNLHNTMNVAVGARKTSGLPGMGNSALSGL